MLIDHRNKIFFEFFNYLENLLKNFPETMIFEIKKDFGNDPFIILITCLLSLRSRDCVVLPIVKKLFNEIKTPKDFLKKDISFFLNFFKKIGLYKKKSFLVKSISFEILDRFNGDVPSDIDSFIDSLISIKGIGKKTANLVLAECFNVDSICVDTHVFKISKELEISFGKNVFEVEKDLMNFFPKFFWKKINNFLVRFWQNFSNKKLFEIKKNHIIEMKAILKQFNS